MSSTAARPPARTAWTLIRSAWESLSVYVPIILMGLMALGTYWLARNTPSFVPAEPQRPVTHDPDYFMHNFSVKTFDASGRLKSEIYGTRARHYPDTDTLEIDLPRFRSVNDRGDLTVATARRALSNADGSEVQLIGDAVVTREAAAGPDGHRLPGLQFRGEFLDVFFNTERIKSHKPVELTRGADRFTADSLSYDNLSQVMDMQGRVRGVLVPAAITNSR
jgi:lipopolysaccharide export system protein LptC